MNFIFIFVFVFKWAFNALFSNDRNRQTIHERFHFIFIFNHYNDVNIIFHFNFFSLRFLRNSDRNVNFFFKKLILNSDTLCLENIKQFFVFDFNKIKTLLRCLRFFFKLNQKILKSSHFRIDDIRLIMCDMINRSNHVANATSLFNLFAHAGNTTNVFD